MHDFNILCVILLTVAHIRHLFFASFAYIAKIYPENDVPNNFNVTVMGKFVAENFKCFTYLSPEKINAHREILILPIRFL